MMKEHRHFALIVVFAVALRSVVDTLRIKKIPINSLTAVPGGSALLPCDTSHPVDDAILLLLWFKDEITTPIYRYDVRPSHSSSKHWKDDILSTRMDITNIPENFILKNLSPRDESFYRCRVDFKRQPTKTTRTYLAVVVPPTNVIIYQDHNYSRRVNSVVGPYRIGETLTLTCVSKGGSPTPGVVWFEDTKLLDKTMESNMRNKDISKIIDEINHVNVTSPTISITTIERPANFDYDPLEGNPFNTLVLGPLARKHLKMLLTCESSNNNITLPTSLVVMVDLILPPLSIELIGPDQPLVAEKKYNFQCITFGARPPPSITWWLNGEEIIDSISTKSSINGNVTTSHLHFHADLQNDNQDIQCLVKSDVTDAILQETTNLTVHYIPHATVKFGSSLNSGNIKEGDDVYFECIIDANPKTFRVTWRQNNELLNHNVTAGVIVSNQSLVMQKVRRQQAGHYSCHSFNILGDGASKPLELNVKYSPVCSENQVTTYAVSRQEDAEVICTVDANPPEATFQWTFNNTADTIEVPQGRYTTANYQSVITYTPVTSLDYGTLLCWATNEIGSQQDPCLFHIVPAGKPDPPRNCTIARLLRTSLLLICMPGNNGGFEQVFHIKVSADSKSFINLTRSIAQFKIDNLSPGRRYKMEITAENERGSSFPVFLSAQTRSVQNSLFDDGPSEAEVRDSSNSVNGFVQTPSSSLPASNSPTIFHSYFEPINLESFLPLAAGIGAGLLLVIIILLILITMKDRTPFNRHNRSQSRQTMLDGPVKDPVETPTDIPLASTKIQNQVDNYQEISTEVTCKYNMEDVPSISDLIENKNTPIYKWRDNSNQHFNQGKCEIINCKGDVLSTACPPLIFRNDAAIVGDSKHRKEVYCTLPHSSYKNLTLSDGNKSIEPLLPTSIYNRCSSCKEHESVTSKGWHSPINNFITNENYL